MMTDASEQVTTVQDYLEQLRQELADSDPALIQDALYDAEEFLRNETATPEPGGDPADRQAALALAIQRFGTPREVAEAYRETDARVAVALAQPATAPGASAGWRLFGVLLDPRAYGSLLFMFLSLATGILYFTWAVTGVALSLGLSVLIISLPFVLLFLASIRLFSLVEGRIVESLLGVRMPRRPRRAAPGSIWARLGARLADGRTWTTLLYMVLKLPLGIFSFTVFTVLLVIPLGLIAAPVAQLFMDQPVFMFGNHHGLYVTFWWWPIFWLASLVDLLIAMHLARAFGRAQGSLAKAMLVDA
jgi:Putative sensor